MKMPAEAPSLSCQITSMKPDNFEPKIVKRDADYVYAKPFAL